MCTCKDGSAYGQRVIRSHACLAQGRDQALLDLLLEAQQRRQPVLIGSGTVEESAQLDALIRRKLAHWQE